MNFEKFLKLFFVVATLIFVGAACAQKNLTTNMNEKLKTDEERAVAAAQKVFSEQKTAGIDMSAGQCLSNEIIPDWVADVVHNPRQAIDDLPENQCPAYREGKAHHFVELDTEGNFIRAH